MLFTLMSFLLPPLFVFGVYHLLTWFNFLHINERVFWKRVAMTSAICHVLLVRGSSSFAISTPADRSFGAYLFNESNFWKLIGIFDTAPMLVILALFALLDRAGMNPPGLTTIAIAITFVIGTLQWFFVGGGVGALLERFFEGLRTPDPEDQDWD